MPLVQKGPAYMTSPKTPLLINFRINRGVFAPGDAVSGRQTAKKLLSVTRFIMAGNTNSHKHKEAEAAFGQRPKGIHQ